MRDVVTGATRGLGAEVARQLSAQGHDVVGTDRSRLDLADPASIARFAQSIDALDSLVANAAVSLDGFDARVARDTLAVNFDGTLALTEAVLPKLGAGGRVVFVSSGMGERAGFSGPALHALDDATRDPPSWLDLGASFVRAVADGTHRRQGWPSSAYSVSKALVNAYARHLARRLADDPRQLRIVAVCPGWVRTDMGGPGAPRSVAQGAAGIVWAVTAPDVPRTGFFRDGRAIPW